MKATRKQLALIHIGKKRLGLDEETYRTVLRNVTSKRSAAQLTVDEAGRVIDHMVELGFRIEAKDDRRGRFRDLRGRPGMASDRELRLIEALWAEIARGDPKRTLRRFVWRMCRVSDVRFLTSQDAYVVIEAIKKMVERRTG